jgi:hypothetical protein
MRISMQGRLVERDNVGVALALKPGQRSENEKDGCGDTTSKKPALFAKSIRADSDCAPGEGERTHAGKVLEVIANE